MLGDVPLLPSLTVFQGWRHLGGGIRSHVRGALALVFACGAMVVFRTVPGLLHGKGIAEVEGSVLLSHARERATGLGLSRAKACINIPVGGDGDDALGASFPYWVRHCGAPCLAARGSRGENPVQI